MLWLNFVSIFLIWTKRYFKHFLDASSFFSLEVTILSPEVTIRKAEVTILKAKGGLECFSCRQISDFVIEKTLPLKPEVETQKPEVGQEFVMA